MAGGGWGKLERDEERCREVRRAGAEWGRLERDGEFWRGGWKR